MAYVLDTYNVIHAAIAMGGAVSNVTVRSLCQWILASPGRLKATLVLDGRAKPDEPSPNEFPDIHLVYSGAGVSADKVIGQLVESARHKKKVTVVTNDRAVALHARRHGASAMSSEEFLHQLLDAQRSHRRAAKAKLPEHKTSGKSSHGETERWLKEFGLTAPPAGPQKAASPGELSDDEIERLMSGSGDPGGT